MAEPEAATRMRIRKFSTGIQGLAFAALLTAVGGTVARAQVTAPPSPPPAAQDTTRPTFGSLLGTVFDSVHSRPLTGATVFVLGSPRVGATNERGLFTVDSLPPGMHRVHVVH